MYGAWANRGRCRAHGKRLGEIGSAKREEDGERPWCFGNTPVGVTRVRRRGVVVSHRGRAP